MTLRRDYHLSFFFLFFLNTDALVRALKISTLIIVSKRMPRVRRTREPIRLFINNETDVAHRGTHHFEENLPMSALESSRNKLKKRISLCVFINP